MTRLWQMWGVFCCVFSRKRRLFISLAVIQAVFAAAIIWGIPLISGETNEPLRLLAASWHLGLIAVGLAVAPQVLAEWKADGYFQELSRLPVPRATLVFAELSSWVVVASPGILITPMFIWLRFDAVPHLTVQVLLVLLLAELIYIGMGLCLVLLFSLEFVQVISQVLMVFAMLFTPILFPVERLPGWLRQVQDFFPFLPLNSVLVTEIGHSSAASTNLAIPVCWAVIAFTISAYVLTKRQSSRRLTQTPQEVS